MCLVARHSTRPPGEAWDNPTPMSFHVNFIVLLFSDIFVCCISSEDIDSYAQSEHSGFGELGDASTHFACVSLYKVLPGCYLRCIEESSYGLSTYPLGGMISDSFQRIAML